MTLDAPKRWFHTALGILTMASAIVDWQGLSALIASHPRAARLLAGAVWVIAHLSKSPIRAGNGPKP